MRIGKYQLGFMTALFVVGATPVFRYDKDTGQDAWISMALSALVGLVFLWLLLTIRKRYPDDDFPKLLRRQFGRWLGWGLACVQSLALMCEAVRSVRDLSDLTVMTILNQTPMAIILLVVCLLCLYTLWPGGGELFQLSELLLPFMLSSFLLLTILIFATGLPDYHQLMPMLESGWGVIVKTTFLEFTAYPFAQMFIFLMFWKYVEPEVNLSRVTYISYGLVSIFIVLMFTVVLATLGPVLSANLNLRYVEVVQMIQLFNFLERLDVLVTLLLFLGKFVKAAIMMLAAILIVKSLMPLTHQWSALLVVAMVYASALVYVPTIQFMWFGIHMLAPLQVSLVLLLFVATSFRLRKH
ncbi:hypothetical protein PA598K_03123 [Paenibacillus sp. 598K]|uniref:GerAB/ArcD/ProY family transporter n=1 Tax=Paenibacillus sp. 598K TaxID=1117987 RepID=UPI000FF910C1|nr:endospore germination permease [Paenibacillus sp. 598K]GBF74758.1 hypothetical protein PA598K_03123 [Paenibacillus sp. 598K]